MQTQLFTNRGLCPRSSVSVLSRAPLQVISRDKRVAAVTFTKVATDQCRRSRCSVIGCATPLADAPAQQQMFVKGDQWSLHKFGGTCVSAAERISHAGDVLVQVALPVHGIQSELRPMSKLRWGTADFSCDR